MRLPDWYLTDNSLTCLCVCLFECAHLPRCFLSELYSWQVSSSSSDPPLSWSMHTSSADTSKVRGETSRGEDCLSWSLRVSHLWWMWAESEPGELQWPGEGGGGGPSLLHTVLIGPDSELSCRTEHCKPEETTLAGLLHYYCGQYYDCDCDIINKWDNLFLGEWKYID